MPPPSDELLLKLSVLMSFTLRLTGNVLMTAQELASGTLNVATPLPKATEPNGASGVETRLSALHRPVTMTGAGALSFAIAVEGVMSAAARPAAMMNLRMVSLSCICHRY